MRREVQQPVEIPSPALALTSGPESEEIVRGGCCLAVSPDGSSVYVAGSAGLARFDATLRLLSYYSCRTGYCDVAVGEAVVCTDAHGTLFAHDLASCELLMRRPFESVQESAAPRAALAICGQTVLLGCDGVLTAYSWPGLRLLARARLADSPQLGVGFVHASPRRVYASVTSTLFVLTPGLQPVTRLRGGPRVPIFGNFSCATESRSGRMLFAGDVGGPSVHVWGTSNWQWLARVEIAEAGGFTTHLALSAEDDVLYAGTCRGRFLAFTLSSLPPQPLEEDSSGGPFVLAGAQRSSVVVLAKGVLFRRLEDQN